MPSDSLMICDDCSTFTVFCQCICPYCGNEIDGGCNCSKETLDIKNWDKHIFDVFSWRDILRHKTWSKKMMII